jgi:hypothetical protein
MHVGIDVGMTTGYAVVGSSGQLLECGNLRPEDLNTSILQQISRTFCAGHPDLDVTIEYPAAVTQARDRALQEIARRVRELFPTARAVQPGTWKQTPAAQVKVPVTWAGDRLTTHQKDAIRIAHWGRTQEPVSAREV